MNEELGTGRGPNTTKKTGRRRKRRGDLKGGSGDFLQQNEGRVDQTSR